MKNEQLPFNPPRYQNDPLRGVMVLPVQSSDPTHLARLENRIFDLERALAKMVPRETA